MIKTMLKICWNKLDIMKQWYYGLNNRKNVCKVV